VKTKNAVNRTWLDLSVVGWRRCLVRPAMGAKKVEFTLPIGWRPALVSSAVEVQITSLLNLYVSGKLWARRCFVQVRGIFVQRTPQRPGVNRLR